LYITLYKIFATSKPSAHLLCAQAFPAWGGVSFNLVSDRWIFRLSDISIKLGRNWLIKKEAIQSYRKSRKRLIPSLSCASLLALAQTEG
jgi:hypothetical protein